MIDWNEITGFDWDQGNDRKNLDKHSVSKTEAEQMFFNKPLLLMPDQQHSVYETRFHALGKSDAERLLHVTFTLRDEGTLIRVISARSMHKKEKQIYAQE